MGNENEIRVSAHCWNYTIEAVDPPQGYGPAHVRDKVESACEDGPGAMFAHEMARAALRLLPHCAQLDPAHHRNEAAILSACGLLRGDRMAAAEVLNRLRPLLPVRGSQDEALIRGLFNYDIRVDWNGEVNTAPGGAAAFWASKIGQPEGVANFYVQSVEGLTARRIRVRGELGRSVGNRPETAEVELVWTNPGGGLLQISEARVGPWRRLAPPGAPAPAN